ncbi:MAG: hypothetical protein COA88_07410 [Kordia sp.]|nr:MAG: hypothetical protein COA88_07410 [Kordia sp.]
MFTTGQLIFAALFSLVFVGVMIWSYRKDFKLHQKHYKGSYWVLVAILVFFSLIYALKSFIYN